MNKKELARIARRILDSQPPRYFHPEWYAFSLALRENLRAMPDTLWREYWSATNADRYEDVVKEYCQLAIKWAKDA